MTEPTWIATDEYLENQFTNADATAAKTLQAQRDAGLPDIAVSPTQAALLEVLVRTSGAHRALEFGTLGGYSTLWMARALPADGHVVTFEKSEDHARVARASLDAAGVGHKVTIRVGPAVQNFETLAEDDPYDLVFIDADKPNNVHYFHAALTRVNPGALIIVDNVVRDGGIADATSTDPAVEGARTVIEAIAADERVKGTVIQTVGRKGYDGLLFATVLSV